MADGRMISLMDSILPNFFLILVINRLDNVILNFTACEEKVNP